MNPLAQCITSQITLSKDETEMISNRFSVRKLKKGQHLLHSGTICREMAFISSGYLRMYDLADGKEITLWIGMPNSFITSLSSFVFESINYWNIEAVTDCELYVIHRNDHFDLTNQSHKWLEFDNHLLARCFALLERSMFAQLHTTAQQRFDTLMNDSPELFNHIPQQHIASMLGIAPETLSRLRKNSMVNNS